MKRTTREGMKELTIIKMNMVAKTPKPEPDSGLAPGQEPSEQKGCSLVSMNALTVEATKIRLTPMQHCGVSYDLCNVLRISYAYLCNVYYVIITSCVLCNTCHAMLSII